MERPSSRPAGHAERGPAPAGAWLAPRVQHPEDGGVMPQYNTPFVGNFAGRMGAGRGCADLGARAWPSSLSPTQSRCQHPATPAGRLLGHARAATTAVCYVPQPGQACVRPGQAWVPGEPPSPACSNGGLESCGWAASQLGGSERTPGWLGAMVAVGGQGCRTPGCAGCWQQWLPLFPCGRPPLAPGSTQGRLCTRSCAVTGACPARCPAR